MAEENPNQQQSDPQQQEAAAPLKAGFPSAQELASEMEPLIGSMMDGKLAGLRVEILQTVNEKLKAQAEHIEETLVKYEDHLQRIIAEMPHPGKCAVEGCGREYGDNNHHQTDRAKYHAFKDPVAAEETKAAAAGETKLDA